MASTPPTPQRAWRSACPNCGAPVEFRSAASSAAVCGFCKSTLLREGEALRRIGQSAELFDDHSPLQLGVSGKHRGLAFTLVGRLQYRSADAAWNAWHALFDAPSAEEPRSAWLSEDNGAYAFSFDAALSEAAPEAAALRVGNRVLVGGRAWEVASVVVARLAAAEGELPRLAAPAGGFVVADLRNAQGEVATLEYMDPARPGWSIGQAVSFAELSLRGLREGAAEKTLQGRAFDCPSCGAPLEVKLDSTRSIVCHQCKAVVDVSQGAGADIAQLNRNHYGQDTPGIGGAEPLVPLGATGTLAIHDGGGGDPLPWQVVGYVERHTVPGPGDDGEQFFWREYLLYNATAGFAFLVDAEDGWSWVRTISGAPTPSGRGVQWRGIEYRERERYRGQISYVLGEFYWKLERGATTDNTDYAGATGSTANRRLNREQTRSEAGEEVVWSAGQTLGADAVRAAFGLSAQPAFARDVQPTAGRQGRGLAFMFFGFLFIALMFSMVRCGRDDCSELRRTYGESSTEYQQCARNAGGYGGGYGGAYGGYSSGSGGHK
ncbi:DUF4178 domain-containing protein [Rivibacter subsaxonicus]|uniref:Uncharacterized protein DUF4178 n=1 Tax=Rivibacter subsaxonicus TaxID=457575 RepID=A0A4Q7VVD8_9BURK|nr:DUF4178 domain-containing protein [Rivibacter subsaxonicus]RZU00627.1 uncharacterized protein DUF4178 [Rivibacter subsaxonicus]